MRPGRWIRKDLRIAIYLRDGLRCLYCGRRLSAIECTLDHVVPEHLGGDHSSRNLVTACGRCNKGKRRKLLKEFASEWARERISRTLRKDIAVYRVMAKRVLLRRLSIEEALERLNESSR